MEDTEKSAIPEQKTNYQFNLVFYFLMALHIVLNWIGSPLVKQLYMGELILVFLCCLILPIKRLLIPLMFFFFVEGQGRIVYEYAQFTRFIYDALISIVILRLIIKDKVLAPLKPFPWILYLGIIGHLAWYAVSIFNPHLASPLLGIVASKLYVFPILFFITFLNSKVMQDQKLIDELAAFTLFCAFTQSALAIHQFMSTEKLLYQISNHYKVVLGEFKGQRFTGASFRPTGTTFAAGGYSTYLFLTVPLIFSRRKASFWYYLVTILCVLTSWVALFFSQVRSSMIKHMLLVFLALLVTTIISRKKQRIFVLMAFLGGILTWGAIPLLEKTLSNSSLINELNLTNAVQRFASLGDVKEASSSRINFEQFLNIFLRKLKETPLGIGAGRSGPAATLFASDIIADPFYNAKYSWHYENLFISLTIDFGIGMIFFSLLIVFLPVFFTYGGIQSLFRKQLTSAKNMAMAAVGTSIIIFGNWAAMGLVTLPESFIFWLYAVIGMSSWQIYKTSPEPTQEALRLESSDEDEDEDEGESDKDFSPEVV